MARSLLSRRAGLGAVAALVASLAAGGAAAAPPAPRESERFAAWRTLDAKVTFLVAGEGGRLAVLADEIGAVVPHRYENGSWAALRLPSTSEARVGQASLGIWFGRDNRPRLMGHRADGANRKMVYLRHRDGVWQDQRSEIGALAGDRAILYGILGEEDPEVVCRSGSICLLKSRKGWKELANTLPESAVFRIAGGVAYAVTAEGLFASGEKGWTQLGPRAPWKTEATGFAVAPGGAVTVAEPAADVLHVLDAPGGAWRAEPSPIDAPRDVAGARGDRWVGGDGGLVHEEGGAFVRPRGVVRPVVRVLATATGAIAAGAEGVIVVGPRDAAQRDVTAPR